MNPRHPFPPGRDSNAVPSFEVRLRLLSRHRPNQPMRQHHIHSCGGRGASAVAQNWVMGCREEVLAVIRAERLDEFSPRDVIDAMQRAGSGYRTSTIRTHICSRMCANAPDHHAVVFNDLVRVGHGLYRLRQ